MKIKLKIKLAILNERLMKKWVSKLVKQTEQMKRQKFKIDFILYVSDKGWLFIND